MERTNEEKLDLLAELLEPVSVILTDDDIGQPMRENKPWIGIISLTLKKHKKELIQIMASVDNVPVEEYEVNLIQLPARLMAFLNRPEVQELFTGQGQKNGNASSGSATGNTEDGAN